MLIRFTLQYRAGERCAAVCFAMLSRSYTIKDYKHASQKHCAEFQTVTWTPKEACYLDTSRVLARTAWASNCKEDPSRSPQRAQGSCEKTQMSTLYEVWGQYQIKVLPDIHKLQEFQHSKVAPASSVSRKFPARSPRLKGSAGLDCEVSTPFWVKALVLEPYRRGLSGRFGVLGRRDRPCSLGRNTWAGHRLRWAAGSTDSLPYLIKDTGMRTFLSTTDLLRRKVKNRMTQP